MDRLYAIYRNGSSSDFRVLFPSLHRQMAPKNRLNSIPIAADAHSKMTKPTAVSADSSGFFRPICPTSDREIKEQGRPASNWRQGESSNTDRPSARKTARDVNALLGESDSWSRPLLCRRTVRIDSAFGVNTGWAEVQMAEDIGRGRPLCRRV